jgi:hypothetical protein
MARSRSAQAYLPGFAPPRQRGRDSDELQAEQVIEQLVLCIDVIRPRHKAAYAPIDMSDVAHCCRECQRALRGAHLPTPDGLLGLIAEICWFREIPITAEVLALANIAVAPDTPRKKRAPDFNDGLPPVGWDPWS